MFAVGLSVQPPPPPAELPLVLPPDAGGGAGLGVSGIVTVTGLDILEFPAVSRATAVRVCTPAPVVAVFQEIE